MIWLIGNRGMLGSEIEELFITRGVSCYTSDMDVDITDSGRLREFAAGKNISWIINCSAYTAVDRAEDDIDRAFLVNSAGVQNIAGVAKEINAKIIHFSTDYVYDGLKSGAYNENDDTEPVTVYGKSKLSGDRLLSEEWHKHFILRISWLFGKNGNNFVFTMLKLFREKDTVKVVNDQWGSPTYTGDLSKALYHIITTDSDKYGIYHYSGEGKITWYDFAMAVYEKAKNYHIIDTNVNIIPIETKDYPTKAKRPFNSYLSKEKILKELHIRVPAWEEMLDSFLSSIKNIEK